MKSAWLAACALLLVACGSDGSDSPSAQSLTVTASPTPIHTASPTPADNVVLIGVAVHLEGWPLGEEPFDRYAERMRDYATLFERYGAKFTWEAGPQAIDGSAMYGDNVLAEMVQRGHAVGVHADAGGSERDTQLEVSSTLNVLKVNAEALGLSINDVSGVCSHLDWVGAVAETGYEIVTGVVAYCWSSTPEGARPAEFRDCESPITCHDPYPETVPERLYPWRPASSENWITHDPAGPIVIMPSAGGLNCADGERASMEGPGGCPFDQSDIDAYLAELDESLAAAEPGKVNIHYVITSLGTPLDLGVMEAWLQAIQPYVERGDVQWATIPQMYEAYVASERN